MIGDAAQYQELVTLYGTYSDQELLQLGRSMGDLTEMAQDALKSEIARRGLKITAAGESAKAPVLTDEDLKDMRAYATSAPDECIFDFEDERTVQAAYYALRRGGIDAIVISADAVRGPRVVVTPKDAERAAEILSQPSTDELKADTEDVTAEFSLPRCPACGGEETLLESVDPVNEWRCDDCGHMWQEESVSSAS
jgi:hypothetical protein